MTEWRSKKHGGTRYFIVRALSQAGCIAETQAPDKATAGIIVLDYQHLPTVCVIEVLKVTGYALECKDVIGESNDSTRTYKQTF